MFASIVDITQFTLRNTLFIVGQAVLLIGFMFICGGILFLIKGKG